MVFLYFLDQSKTIQGRKEQMKLKEIYIAQPNKFTSSGAQFQSLLSHTSSLHLYL